MAKFLCFAVYDGKPTDNLVEKSKNVLSEPNKFNRNPESWCIMGIGKTYSGPTLAQIKSEVIFENIGAEFIEKCGWILVGEENKLLDKDCQEIIVLGL